MLIDPQPHASDPNRGFLRLGPSIADHVAETVRGCAESLQISHAKAGQGFEEFFEDVMALGRPAWFADWLNGSIGQEWLDDLSAGGWDARLGNAMLYATPGVGPHADHLTGTTAALVLFNDGLVFEQGNQRHRTRPGEWFIFDDYQPHAVHPGTGTSIYLVAVMPAHQWR
jgi:hypothetical protein